MVPQCIYLLVSYHSPREFNPPAREGRDDVRAIFLHNGGKFQPTRP